MKHRFVRVCLALAFISGWCVGCGGGNTITKGTTPVTALAPSEPTNYPVGPGDANKPPNPKDFLKGKIPNKKK
jgi:hypothetical protein